MLLIAKRVLMLVLLSCIACSSFRFLPSLDASPGVIHVPDDYPTMQQAIDSAVAGDTIYVHNGTYNENITVDKRLYIYGDGFLTTTIDGGGVAPVVNMSASEVVLSGFRIRNSGSGAYYMAGVLLLESTAYCVVENNLIEECYFALTIRGHSHEFRRNRLADNAAITDMYANSCRIEENFILQNDSTTALSFVGSSNVVGLNTIETNGGTGIWLGTAYLPQFSTFNTIYGNKIVNCVGGIYLDDGVNNTFYHNSFINCTLGVAYVGSLSLGQNAWDVGWPVGGNYWENHDNTDERSGPNQLGPGSDGIADAQYEVYLLEYDRFPCAGPIDYYNEIFSTPQDAYASYVIVVSNSTLSGFDLNETDGAMRFDVTGTAGSGFCRVAVINELVTKLWGLQNDIRVLVDGVPIGFGNWTASYLTYIYFKYPHSTRHIVIAVDADEYFYEVECVPFDDSGDGLVDAVEIRIDADTTFNGVLAVSVMAQLTDPDGMLVGEASQNWIINGTLIEYAYVQLYVPPNHPLGFYTAHLFLYDGYEKFEDETHPALYLYPPVVQELLIESFGPGTTDPPPDLYLHPNGSEVGIEALPNPGCMLERWVLDSVDIGAPNPVFLLMDEAHALSAFFVEIPPDKRELAIEIDGSGTTSPPPGVHLYNVGEIIVVEALPDPGWAFSHWILDSVEIGSDNPVPIDMSESHVLLAVFSEIPPPTIESCDDVGVDKNEFDIADNVYIYGTGFEPSGVFYFYLVEDIAWSDGTPIPPRIPDTEGTVSSDAFGNIQVTAVWNAPRTITGKFDLIIDVNENGVYDLGVDALDDSDVEVTAGIVIPELGLMLLLLTTALLTAAIGVNRKKLSFRMCRKY